MCVCKYACMYVCVYVFFASKIARAYTYTYTTIDSHLPLSRAGPEASAGKMSARPSPPSDAADCGGPRAARCRRPGLFGSRNLLIAQGLSKSPRRNTTNTNQLFGTGKTRLFTNKGCITRDPHRPCMRAIITQTNTITHNDRSILMQQQKQQRQIGLGTSYRQRHGSH